MFSDQDWLHDESQKQRWRSWVQTVTDTVEDFISRRDDGTVRVVVLELGAGGNVTTVRQEAEEQLLRFHGCGADVRLVRVNPELPLGDRGELGPGGELAHLVISIM